jgi:hypothetical protein
MVACDVHLFLQVVLQTKQHTDNKHRAHLQESALKEGLDDQDIEEDSEDEVFLALFCLDMQHEFKAL